MNRFAAQVRQISQFVVAIAVLLLAIATQGGAQAPGLFKMQPQKRDEPISIKSDKLEVRDKDKMATFSGNVQIVQGENDVRCNALAVFYEEQKGKSAPKATPDTDRGSQQIRRMECRGSVVLTQKEQRAVGERADFDVPNNILTLTGKVVVTRGEDVMRGHRLIVNMATGVAQVESGGGQVEMLINPKSQPKPGK